MQTFYRNRSRRFNLTTLSCKIAAIAVFALLTAATAFGAAVRGQINITQRLTKASLRPVATAYGRGVLVEPKGVAEDLSANELDRIAIYIESNASLSAEPVTAVIEQRGRRFVTQTVVIPIGSEVSFPNFDPIFHNVFSLSKARSFDLGNYSKGQTRIVKFRKPGFVKVYCHLHPDMRAVVVVTPNDRATKPTALGEYQIPDVPPGEHTLIVWHPTSGSFRRPLVIGDSEDAVVNFEIPVEIGDRSKH